MNDILDNPNIKEIFRRFRERNYEIYIVGGAVRDYLLNEPIKDIDFTTNAKPYEIEKLFEKTIETGKAFGTITVCLNQESFQITTYRKESDYCNKRHPSKLSFSDNLIEDLSRRDLTINALVLDEEGNILDFTNGLEDLKNKTIRTIGDPYERLSEDQLRKWRVFRFATQKNFKIDPETFESILKNPDTSFISIERIQDEFFKILEVPDPEWGGKLLTQTPLLTDLLTRIGLEVKEDLNTCFSRIKQLPKDLALRLSVFFLNTDRDSAQEALTNLRVSNSLKDRVLKFLKSYEILNSPFKFDQIKIKKVLAQLGEENFYNLLELLKAQDNNSDYDTVREEIKRIINAQEPLLIRDLNITGNDLKDLGFKGKEIGEALDFLLELVYKKHELNNKETLIEILRNEKTNIN